MGAAKMLALLALEICLLIVALNPVAVQCQEAGAGAGELPTESAQEKPDASSDEKIWNLLQLGSKYNKIVRPPPDYNTTNVVYIAFVVLKLLGLNEIAQHMSLEGYTEMEWNDPRLAWLGKANGAFDNVTMIYLPQISIWMPDVITINSVEQKDSTQPLSTILLADGRVFTSTPYNTKTLCDINLLYFPFDTQTCRVVFGSWLMVKADLELRLLNKNASAVLSADTFRQESIASDEYCITKSDFAVTPQNEPGACQEAVFTISIQRKPLFYIINLIIPSFLILLICLFSFLLPPDSGDRLALNITLMLTLMVFTQIVAGYTPAQSDSVPMLTRFFSVVVAITAISTVGSIFQLYCCYKSKTLSTAPARAIRAVCLCKSRSSQGHSRTNDPDQNAADEITVPKTAGESEWLIVGRRLDYVLFVFMVISVATLAVFISLARNPDFVDC